MSREKILLILILSTAIIGATYFFWTIYGINETSKYGDVTVQQARDLIQTNPKLVIIDIRTQEEFDGGHIEDAILMPLNEFETRLGELSVSSDLLVYCRTGNRSARVVIPKSII